MPLDVLSLLVGALATLVSVLLYLRLTHRTNGGTAVSAAQRLQCDVCTDTFEDIDRAREHAKEHSAITEQTWRDIITEV